MSEAAEHDSTGWWRRIIAGMALAPSCAALPAAVAGAEPPPSGNRIERSVGGRPIDRPS